MKSHHWELSLTRVTSRWFLSSEWGSILLIHCFSVCVCVGDEHHPVCWLESWTGNRLHLFFRRLVTCWTLDLLVWSWNVLSLTRDVTVNFTSDFIWSNFSLSCFYDQTLVGKSLAISENMRLFYSKKYNSERNKVMCETERKKQRKNIFRTNIYSGK